MERDFGRSEAGVHPAIRAWHRLGLAGSQLTAVETLKATEATSVYRLHGAGPAGVPVVAKRRSHRATLRIEGIVYEKVLPALRLANLHFYGTVEEDDGDWLFLEDAGGRPYSEDRASDRVLAGTWLGAMHAATSECELAGMFPGRELSQYLDYLQLTRINVGDHLARGKSDRKRRSGLERLVGQLDALEQSWSRIVAVWEKLPRCLMHGDFISSNLRVREGNSGPTLHIIDWGRAGWGVPAKDIAGLDFDAYWREVQRCWAHFGRETIQMMADLGDVLRYLDWMEGTSQYLGSSSNSWVEELEDDLLLYGALLDRATLKAALL